MISLRGPLFYLPQPLLPMCSLHMISSNTSLTLLAWSSYSSLLFNHLSLFFIDFMFHGRVTYRYFLSTGIFPESADRNHMTSLEIFPWSRLYMMIKFVLFKLCFVYFPCFMPFSSKMSFSRNSLFFLALPIRSKETKFSQCWFSH